MSNTLQPIQPDDSQIRCAEPVEVVLYQPDETISLEVKLDVNYDTVWLNQQQMAELYGTKRQAITKHIANIYDCQELQRISTSSILEQVRQEGNRKVTRKIEYYNLDMIISVGYRVNTKQGIAFRQWATNVLKQHLLRGYSVNQQLLAMQRQLDTRFDEQSQRMLRIEDTQSRQQQQLDFFIRTSTPPAEMVFFEGDFYTARVALENLVRTATRRAIIIDAYVNALTLDILDTRAPGVQALIYTTGVGPRMTRLMQEHDRLFPSPDAHIDIRKWRNESHDRFLIIDDRLYHCGHSLNANGGHKMSAITLMGTSPDTILSQVQ